MALIRKSDTGMSPLRTLLSDFFDADDFSLNRMLRGSNTPSVNISENENNFEIELAAPGLQKKDFKVSVDNGVLTISAEKREEKEVVKKNFTRKEFSYNSFSRSFTLPENVMEDDIKAHYEDGVLKLTLAKKSVSVSKAKQIEIV